MFRPCDALRLFHGRTAQRSIAVHKRAAMTVIVDYGAGNLRSVENTLAELNAVYTVTNQADVIASATKLLLPGVGHFGQMLQAIDRLGIRSAILKAIRSGIPTLGICLGLQSFFESSEEA